LSRPFPPFTIARVLMNERMKPLWREAQGWRSQQLGPVLGGLAEGGFLESRGCILWRPMIASNELHMFEPGGRFEDLPEDYRRYHVDRSGVEASQHIHLEYAGIEQDHLGRALQLTRVAFSDFRANHPALVLRAVISVAICTEPDDIFSCTLRFHVRRADEPGWCDEARLEDFKEEGVLIVDSDDPMMR
jgi:hypothetical protein